MRSGEVGSSSKQNDEQNNGGAGNQGPGFTPKNQGVVDQREKHGDKIIQNMNMSANHNQGAFQANSATLKASTKGTDIVVIESKNAERMMGWTHRTRA